MEQLEHGVARLEELPARVDALTLQIVQLRAEMHGEFSAVRGEMQSEFSTVRAEIQALNAQMRMLFEELVSRIATLREGRNDVPKRKRKK